MPGIVYRKENELPTASSDQSGAFHLSPESGVDIYEYPRSSPLLGLSYFEVNGRRPSDSSKVYLESACTFSLFVLEGSGTMLVDGTEYQLEPKVLVSVLPNTKWCLEGTLKYVVATSPGFFPEQMAEVPAK